MCMYQPDLETLARSELRRLQLERLNQTLQRIHAHNPDYARRLGGPDEVHSLENISRFPFMVKEDLRKAYPFGVLCAPRESLVRIQTSSGTTGTPILNAYTAGDVTQWSEIMARCLTVAGITSRDVIQLTPSFGLFNGRFGFHFGATAIGAMIVPIGAGRTSMQLQLMRDLGTTALGAIASYPLRLMEVARAERFAWRGDSQLRVGVCGAEAWSDEMRARIEEEMGIQAFDIIGMTETGGVGLGIDCPAHDGIHVWEDHYLIEIVDPETGDPLPDGQRGEMVITTLTREGVPLIRFRTGDITSVLTREPCRCGRTHLRVDRLSGRTDDMVKIKGVNFYPKQVESLLLMYRGVAPDYQIIIDRTEGRDEVSIVVEVYNPHEPGLAACLHETLFDRLGFHASIQLVPVGGIERVPGKALRVIDKRIARK